MFIKSMERQVQPVQNPLNCWNVLKPLHQSGVSDYKRNGAKAEKTKWMTYAEKKPKGAKGYDNGRLAGKLLSQLDMENLQRLSP